MRVVTRAMRRQLERDNAKQPADLTPVPPSEWPPVTPPGLVEVWRSRDYLVQLVREPAGLRLSVNSTRVRPDGRWDDGLTWDELQAIKRQIGLGDCYAVEVYPPDRDVVNVANMRHLWILPEPLPIGWRRKG